MGHRFILEAYKGQRTRHTCPGCNKRKEFTKYIDTETNQYLAEHVGKCNRESKCSYHYTPSQFFRDNPEAGTQPLVDWKQSEAYKTAYQPPKEEPVQYLPWEVLNKTMTGYQDNNFVRFLTSLFGEEEALQLALKYKLGTSKKWQNDGGKAVVFWQIDSAGNIHQAKVMAYNPQTGKRLKAEGKHYISFMGKAILKNREATLQQCLFGEHLLPENPSLPVALVESEKTAVIMSGFLPTVVWLATGGKNGARWTERNVYKALEGRTVTIYPDLGAFDEWKGKAKILGTVCSYKVSELLEVKAQGDDRQEGCDIADYFTRSQNEVEQPTAKEEPVQAQEIANEPEPEEPEQEAVVPLIETNKETQSPILLKVVPILKECGGRISVQELVNSIAARTGIEKKVVQQEISELFKAGGLLPKNYCLVQFDGTTKGSMCRLKRNATYHKEVKTATKANPAAGQLIETFGLVIERIEHWEPEEEAELAE